MTVLIGMFLLGLFIALGTWVVSWSDHVKRELVVKVYFDAATATKAQMNAVANRLVREPRRQDASTFVSKEEALKQMTKRFPELVHEPALEPAARLARGRAEARRADARRSR